MSLFSTERGIGKGDDDSGGRQVSTGHSTGLHCRGVVDLVGPDYPRRAASWYWYSIVAAAVLALVVSLREDRAQGRGWQRRPLAMFSSRRRQGRQIDLSVRCCGQWRPWSISATTLTAVLLPKAVTQPTVRFRTRPMEGGGRNRLDLDRRRSHHHGSVHCQQQQQRTEARTTTHEREWPSRPGVGEVATIVVSPIGRDDR